MKLARRIRRGNVHPIYGNKFRKGNNGDKLSSLQVIVIEEHRPILRSNEKHIYFGESDKTKLYRTRTIQHWKMN